MNNNIARLSLLRSLASYFVSALLEEGWTPALKRAMIGQRAFPYMEQTIPLSSRFHTATLETPQIVGGIRIDATLSYYFHSRSVPSCCR